MYSEEMPMYCKNVYENKSYTTIVHTDKMYFAVTDTIKKTTVKFLYTFKFRKIAEFFYLVMFPAVEVEGFFIQNINNICKSTVN